MDLVDGAPNAVFMDYVEEGYRVRVEETKQLLSWVE